MSGNNNRTDRPWGSFFILDDQQTAKVKRLVVNPGERLSYQSHKQRDEHWVIIRGIATVILDDVERDFGYGEHVFVKRGTKHRISCRGKEAVELIEVQVGNSFDEDDITRYSDDYGREGTVG